MSRRRFDPEFYPVSKPKRVAGGIRAQTQRGAFGTRWWGKRWIAVLEALDLGGRLARGRSYARAGQVLDIVIVPGRVTATVQGSRPRPYAVAITVAKLDAAAWERVTAAILAEARFAAPLLAGEMPQEIEAAFAAAGSPLFPASGRELQTECSCPDWSNPCKHVAAVYYLLGEEFDRDPFLLFTLRGRTISELFATLAATGTPAASIAEDEPLRCDAETFWRGAAPRSESRNAPAGAPPHASRALPSFPFWRAVRSLREFVAETDEAAGERADALLAAVATSGTTDLVEPETS